MSAGGILFWSVLLCLAWIGGVGIYFERVSSKRPLRRTMSSAAAHGRATRR